MDHLVKFSLLLLFCISFATAVDKDISEKDINVKISGKSGKMRLGRKENHVTITFDYVKEFDSSNAEIGKSGSKKHAFNSFANQNFTFRVASVDKYQNIPVKNVKFESFISGPDANLVVDVYIFKEKGQVRTSNNETIDVDAGTVKFDVNLSNWTFCGGAGGDSCKKGSSDEVGDKVELGIEMKSKQNKGPKKKGTPRGKGRKIQTVDIGDVDCTLSGAVKIDNVWEEMESGFPKMEVTGGKTLLRLRFKRFNSNVFYDPTMDLQTSASTSLKIGFIPLVALIAFIIQHLL